MVDTVNVTFLVESGGKSGPINRQDVGPPQEIKTATTAMETVIAGEDQTRRRHREV